MKHPTTRRRMLGAAALSLCAWPALAQTTEPAYPSRPISLVVPYAAGGVTDVVARMIATPLARELGQSVIVENVTGAGGNLGAQKVASASAAGYTLLLSQTSLVTNPLLDRAFRLDSVADFTHIAFVGGLPLWVLIDPARPGPKTLAQLVQTMRQSPGQMTYGSGGTGSASHLGVAFLEKLEKVQALHVPYRGMSAALTDLLTGSVNFALMPVAGTEAMVQSGKLKALALTASSRLKAFPDVPTFAEMGQPGMDVMGWIGISGPKGMPPSVIARLHAAAQRVLSDPQISVALAERTLQLQPRTPSQFTAYIQSEKARWQPLIEANGIKAE
jgi:tripartite-type tricarboxylate transporter receptor subunit TctC